MSVFACLLYIHHLCLRLALHVILFSLCFRLSSSTEQSSSSQLMRRHKRRRRRHKVAKIDRVSPSETQQCPRGNMKHMRGPVDVFFLLYFVFSLPFQSSSFSSITDSTMSLNIITVTLNMGKPDDHDSPLSFI